MQSLLHRAPHKKAQALCLALLPLCLLYLLCPPLQAQTIQAKTHPETLAPLKVAIYPSPFGYQDNKGVTHGVRPDFIAAIAKLMGWEVEFIHMPYLRAAHELKTGGVDILNGINIPSTYVRLPPEAISPLTPHTTLPLSLYSLADRGFEIKTRDEAKRYRIGALRRTSTEQRTPWLGQESTDYFEDADKLIKALLAKRVDVVILEPVSAAIISKQLGVKLRRVFDYSTVESFPLFSAKSPRIRNTLIFCQDFIAAQIKVYDSGKYAEILKTNNMDNLLTYFNQGYSPSCRIIPAE